MNYSKTPIINPITHGIFEPAVPRGGGGFHPPHWKTHTYIKLGRIQKFRPLALKMGLEIFLKSDFFALSEMRKNMVSGENLHHSLKF